MPCASNQCNWAPRTVPSGNRPRPKPFSFLHRPRPNRLTNSFRIRTPVPTAIGSTSVISPMKVLDRVAGKGTAAALSLKQSCTTSEVVAPPLRERLKQGALANARLNLEIAKEWFPVRKKHRRDWTDKNGPPRLPEARRNLPHRARAGR